MKLLNLSTKSSILTTKLFNLSSKIINFYCKVIQLFIKNRQFLSRSYSNSSSKITNLHHQVYSNPSSKTHQFFTTSTTSFNFPTKYHPKSSSQTPPILPQPKPPSSYTTTARFFSNSRVLRALLGGEGGGV